MNSPAPVPTPFQVALERYQNALNYLGFAEKVIEKYRSLNQ